MRCVTADVDLEALAGGYRHRPPSAAALGHAAGALTGIRPGSWVLDIGTGRGDHAAIWAGRGYRAVALDPGVAMASAAAHHSGVAVVRGLAQALPFRDRTLSLAYFHLSVHYGDWKKAIDEASRVLRPGGVCVVWTLGGAHHRDSRLAKWFPSVVGIDTARFPEPALVASRLENAGHEVETGKEIEVVERTAGEWATAVRAGFVSTLQLVGERELDAGLAAFAAAHPDPEECVTYELRWDWIQGHRFSGWRGSGAA